MGILETAVAFVYSSQILALILAVIIGIGTFFIIKFFLNSSKNGNTDGQQTITINKEQDEDDTIFKNIPIIIVSIFSTVAVLVFLSSIFFGYVTNFGSNKVSFLGEIITTPQIILPILGVVLLLVFYFRPKKA